MKTVSQGFKDALKNIKQIDTIISYNDGNETISLSNDDIEFVTGVISSHMGNWNTDYNGNEVLPKPKDKYQRFVHMCDYLASRKVINVEFNGIEIIE